MLRKCRINDCRHEISVSLFFSSVNKVKESLFFYSKKRTKPSILISCGFYCVVGFCRGCRRLLQVADHPQVCLGALSPFETSAKDPPEICYLERWCAMRISISRKHTLLFYQQSGRLPLT